MIAKNKKQVWAMVDKFFPCDYEYNTAYTYNAGYDVYTSIAYGSACRIADLGDRLEVTVGDYTFNIWIENVNKDGYFVDYNNGVVIGPIETLTDAKLIADERAGYTQKNITIDHLDKRGEISATWVRIWWPTAIQPWDNDSNPIIIGNGWYGDWQRLF